MNADMSAVTTTDFSAQTSLAKLLCTESQGIAVSWSLALSTNHLYTGKDYGSYNTPAGGPLPCYVLSVAAKGSYKLVYCDVNVKKN